MHVADPDGAGVQWTIGSSRTIRWGHNLGARAVTAATPAAAASAITVALTQRGVTVIHAPVTPTGALDVRRDALELVATSPARPSQPIITVGHP